MRTKKQIKVSAIKEIKTIIKEIQEKAINNIDRALNCGAIAEDSEFLDDNSLLPRCLIEDAATNYVIRLDCYKKESKNIQLFL